MTALSVLDLVMIGEGKTFADAIEESRQLARHVEQQHYSRYWIAELARAGVPAPQPFACTVLLSRRLYPEAPSHKLGSLVDWFQLPRTGRAHRALADAEMAAELLQRIQHDLRTRHGVAEPDHAYLMGLQRCTKAAVAKLLARHAVPQGVLSAP